MKEYLKKIRDAFEWGSQAVQADTQRIVLFNARIESRLRELLIEKFISMQVDATKSKIEKDMSGDFSSPSRMAKLAYYLGLIDTSLYKDILNLNKLRNNYAHSHEPLGPLESNKEGFERLMNTNIYKKYRKDFIEISEYRVYRCICEKICDDLEEISKSITKPSA